MKKRTKWIIGIAIVVFLLIIISNSGKKSSDASDFSGIDTRVDVEQPLEGSSDLEELQEGLDALQDKINQLEAEDLGGLSS
jgi:hypothetical protein